VVNEKKNKKNRMRVCKLIKIFKLKREESVGENEEREKKLWENYKREERKGLRKSRTHQFLDFLTYLFSLCLCLNSKIVVQAFTLSSFFTPIFFHNE